MEEKFQLGFWNYVEPGVYGPEAVKDWTDCGMNLAISPRFNFEKHNVDDYIAVLDACEKQNVKVILDVEGLQFRDAADEITYRKNFQKAYDLFGKHPCTYGFYIGDEPSAEGDAPYHSQFENCITAAKINKEIAPELNPFLNLLPYWPGIQNDLKLDDDYVSWFTRFIKESGLSMISYDCYFQMDDSKPDGVDLYYQNLKKFREIADRAGVELWVTDLAVGHYHYRCPSEDDFRWQLNTSVACGANCVMWFYMYMRWPRINYRVAPFDEHYEKTATYTSLSRIQRSFMRTYGELFPKLKHVRTIQSAKTYAGFELLNENNDAFIESIGCKFKEIPTTIGEFKDQEGQDYIAIVNNSTEHPEQFTVQFKDCVKDLYRRVWDNKEVNYQKDDCVEGKSQDGRISVEIWLAPGQMEVYRIEK